MHMESIAKTGRPRSSLNDASLRSVPGWSKLGQIDFPGLAMSRQAGDRRFSRATAPRSVLEALVLMLWLDLGHIERRKRYPKSCPPSSLSRTLRAWTPDAADPNSPLRLIWRGYMDLLTSAQRAQWVKRLTTQADSWSDWDNASRLAIRAHSPWFRIILAETIRGQ